MNNYDLIYELSYFNLDYGYFKPIVFIICLIVFTRIYVVINKLNGNERYNTPEQVSTLRELCILISVFPILFCFITTILFTLEYKNVFIPYQNCIYETVEGSIEDFLPMPYEGRGNHESFRVGEVEFEYSDYESGFGYRKSSTRGGIFADNGQKVKIGYINYKNTNRIVRIEIIKG